MEQIPPNLPLKGMIRVLSVVDEGDPPRVEVEAGGVHYQVGYIQPNEAPRLKAGDKLSVEALGTMMMVQRVNANGDLESGRYGLFEWRRL